MIVNLERGTAAQKFLQLLKTYKARNTRDPLPVEVEMYKVLLVGNGHLNCCFWPCLYENEG